MNALARRKNLIQIMNNQESGHFNCIGCTGRCCTFEANSMMISPLEAIDILQYLDLNLHKTPQLRKHLEENVQTYRLDRLISTGGKSSFRRTYTCPFFTHKELGCSLPKEYNPYGCLAFNSHHAHLKADENCFSDVAKLIERENIDGHENQVNEKLRSTFKLIWDKAPIPVALLDLWDQNTTSFYQE